MRDPMAQTAPLDISDLPPEVIQAILQYILTTGSSALG